MNGKMKAPQRGAAQLPPASSETPTFIGTRPPSNVVKEQLAGATVATAAAATAATTTATTAAATAGKEETE